MLWLSPFHLRPGDAAWLVPFLGISSGLLAGDTQIEKSLPTGPGTINRSQTLSTWGVGAFAGASGAAYLLGRFSHNDHMRETGWLSGEAAIDSYLATSAIKFAAGRENPLQGNRKGSFWQGGASFPSDHAAAAWSMATVIAHEYPGGLTKLFAYGAAAAISAARVTGRDHFASDAFVGSALGWYLGRQVYRAHHDPELDGADWGALGSGLDETPRAARNMGSPYVPLDSWIYPAFDRLAALGFLQTDFEALRPWTRLQCLDLLQQAGARLDNQASGPSEAASLYRSLREEFSPELRTVAQGENRSAGIDSIYTRVMPVWGTPLNDSGHFGQTVVNDFGRPYGEGANLVSGFTAGALDGSFVFYFRGEYQHAPAVPGYSLPVRQVIATVDDNPLQPALSTAAVNRFEPVEAYAGVALNGWQITFGKQSLWWGPGQSSSLLFSDNAEPMYMLRVSQTSPALLPGFLSRLGPMRTEVFFGKFSGQHFPGNAYLHGEKIMFKPTPNLELGFSRTAELGGLGRSLTSAAILNSYFSARESSSYGPTDNPGKRTAGFDFSYRLPFVRNWLTLYLDSLSSDDPSPLASPRRAAISPGIYLSHFPKLPKLDFRAEAANTNTPSSTPLGNHGRFIYYDFYYHDFYTNKSNIIGSWVGRDALGLDLSSNYWFSATNKFQVAYRRQQTDAKFIPGGGDINELSSAVNWKLRPDLTMAAGLQYDRWLYPLLAKDPQRNVGFSLEFVLTPKQLRTR